MFLGLTRFDINMFKQYIYPVYTNLEFANVSVFFQLWDNEKIYPNEETHSEMFKTFNGLIIEQCSFKDFNDLRPAAVTTISNIDLAEKIAKFGKVELDNKLVKFDTLYKPTIDNMVTFMWDLRRYVRVISRNCQYYSMEETYKTVTEYEISNNVTFDYIIKTRYDVIVESNFQSNLESAISNTDSNTPTVITTHCGIWQGEEVDVSTESTINFNGFTDTILVMNRTAADLFYNNLLYNASSLVSLALTMNKSFSEENAFYTICKIKNIAINEYFFNHILLREELLTKYDITNLFNNVAHVNNEISYVDSDSIILERNQRIAIHKYVNELVKNNNDTA